MNRRRLATAFTVSTCVLIASVPAEVDPSPLVEQARQTLLKDEEVLTKRDFVKTAFRSTAIAALRQPITTARLGKASFWKRGHALLVDNLPLPDLFPETDPPAPGTPAFETKLDKLGIAPALPGSLHYLVGGEAFFTEFEALANSARESIDVQVFIFDNDDVSVACSELLRARARHLPVRVLFDDLGSTFAHGRLPPSGLPEGFVQPRDIGAHLLRGDTTLQLRQTLNPWLATDHTKLLLFDHETAIIGGMNLGRESRHEWHDLMVKVEGPIVRPLQADFERTWKKAGPRGDLVLFEKRKAIQAVDQPGPRLRILRTDAAEGRREILDAMLHALRGSRKRIWIETPYFAMDVIAAELQRAAKRGVEVRVILPKRANHGIMDAGNLVTAGDLLRAGVKVYHHPRMTHLKAMICDGWAIVGSANLDTISLRINRELNLSYHDPELVKQLEDAVFRPDFEASALLALKDTELLLAPLLESIADQL